MMKIARDNNPSPSTSTSTSTSTINQINHHASLHMMFITILYIIIALVAADLCSRVQGNSFRVGNIVRSSISNYNAIYQVPKSIESLADRRKAYAEMVNNFYDVVTWFYLQGWGPSFHFAVRNTGEGFHESLTRSEHFIALKLGLGVHSNSTDETNRQHQQQTCLDVGCGVGGPMKTIAAFSGVNIIGINNNSHQIELFKQSSVHEHHWRENQISMVKSDFMNMCENEKVPVADAAYAIESTCHSPDKQACFRQIYDKLKPGAKFMIYEWCVTDKYDSSNPDHVTAIQNIEVGNCLPTLATFSEVDTSLEAAGFIIDENWDVQSVTHDRGKTEWYATLQGSFSISGFRMTRFGRWCTHQLVTACERIGLAPEGSVQVSYLLNTAADDLVLGGKLGIFTPTYCVICHKPAHHQPPPPPLTIDEVDDDVAIIDETVINQFALDDLLEAVDHAELKSNRSSSASTRAIHDLVTADN